MHGYIETLSIGSGHLGERSAAEGTENEPEPEKRSKFQAGLRDFGGPRRAGVTAGWRSRAPVWPHDCS